MVKVKSTDMYGGECIRAVTVPERIMTPRLDKGWVALRKDNKSYSRCTLDLVVQHFGNPPVDGYDVIYRDGNPRNHDIRNLVIIPKKGYDYMSYGWAIEGANSYFKLDLRKRTRETEYVKARKFLAVYLLHRTDLTLKGVANILNHKNHTTVIHARRDHEELMSMAHIPAYRKYKTRYIAFCDHMDKYVPAEEVEPTFSPDNIKGCIFAL